MRCSLSSLSGLAWVLSLCLSGGLATADDRDVTREALLATLESIQAEIRDVELIYEGSIRFRPTPDADLVPIKNRSPKPYRTEFFQGSYAYRTASLVHLDLYTWEGDEMDDPGRVVWSFAADRKSLSSQPFVAGGGPSGPVQNESSWFGFFFQSQHPGRFHLTPRLIAYLRDKDHTYRQGGWELVDGQNCLIADISTSSGGRVDRFWVDLQRLGHVVRHEHRLNDQLVWDDTVDVLRQVAGRDGKLAWFPMKSTYRHYDGGFRLYAEPTSIEVSGVVQGTIRINQDLPDSRFRLDYRADRAEPPPAWRKAEAARTARKSEGSRTERERLETQLAQANERDAELRSSGGEGSSWIARNAAQLGLYGLGAILIFAAWRIRGGSA